MTTSTPVGTPEDGVPLGSPDTGHVIEEVTEAARRVVAGVVRTSRDNPHLERIRDTLREIADLLDEHAPDVDTRLAEIWATRPTRTGPVTGAENPVAPPVAFRGRGDGSVGADVTLDLQYQGPPAMVHGGISALILDHALGNANDFAGRSGMTAELTVRYHRTTPLFEPLTVRARHLSTDGRKIRTVGDIRTADGRVCVSAEGLFIAGYPSTPPPVG
ncbi:MAG: PaaI family thioesterase [Rhodococcus sp.]|uniref:hotdog domain-containing protein n=1 Tax=Rhodococcus TaxID=1827 RepID=UPI0016BB066E|nr:MULTISPECIES: hotdog domain-containing protein [Rhodococcus]NLV78594.1 PaaI family thioesterase [Rhodococcus sp. (in: high G+C Gram-positive bacteria)]